MTDRARLIYDDLRERYGKATLTKKELANELGVSLSTIDNYVSKGYGIPPYRKLGTARNAKVVFNVGDVAKFLSETIEVA